MAIMRETPRSLAIYFVIVGIISLLANAFQLNQLAAIARITGGLSGTVLVVLLMTLVSIACSLVYLVAGVRFTPVALAAPSLVPTMLIVGMYSQ